MSEIDEAVKAATEGLLAKNKELLREVKTAQEKLSKFSDVDLEALNAASEELSKLKNEKLEKDGEYKKMYETQKEQSAKVIKDLESKNHELVSALKTTKKKNALTTSLAESGVIPELMDVAVNTLLSEVSITDDDSVMAGENPVSDFVKSWTASDVGKHFVNSGNSGGGGNGSAEGRVDAAEKFFDKKSESYNLTEQGKIAKGDPERFNRLKEKYS
jgi:hypothetical protein